MYKYSIGPPFSSASSSSATTTNAWSLRHVRHTERRSAMEEKIITLRINTLRSMWRTLFFVRSRCSDMIYPFIFAFYISTTGGARFSFACAHAKPADIVGRVFVCPKDTARELCACSRSSVVCECSREKNPRMVDSVVVWLTRAFVVCGPRVRPKNAINIKVCSVHGESKGVTTPLRWGTYHVRSMFKNMA